MTPHFLKAVRGDAAREGLVADDRGHQRADREGDDERPHRRRQGRHGQGGRRSRATRSPGKTGTAQKPILGGHGYAAGKYVASFAGFLPAEDPRVLIVVTIDEPAGIIYGGSVAAPLFSSLAAYTVEHLKIPPPVRAAGLAVADRRRRTPRCPEPRRRPWGRSWSRT